tara:strand:- start:129 stop:752 length:624 start_codon:yes stop_codon:yes gene_type:complete
MININVADNMPNHDTEVFITIEVPEPVQGTSALNFKSCTTWVLNLQLLSNLPNDSGKYTKLIQWAQLTATNAGYPNNTMSDSFSCGILSKWVGNSAGQLFTNTYGVPITSDVVQELKLLSNDQATLKQFSFDHRADDLQGNPVGCGYQPCSYSFKPVLDSFGKPTTDSSLKNWKRGLTPGWKSLTFGTIVFITVLGLVALKILDEDK